MHSAAGQAVTNRPHFRMSAQPDAGAGMFEEYEFILPDGTSRFKMVDLSSPARPQVFAFKRMHRAVAAWPVRMDERFASHRLRLQRRLRTGSLLGTELS